MGEEAEEARRAAEAAEAKRMEEEAAELARKEAERKAAEEAEEARRAAEAAEAKRMAEEAAEEARKEAERKAAEESEEPRRAAEAAREIIQMAEARMQATSAEILPPQLKEIEQVLSNGVSLLKEEVDCVSTAVKESEKAKDANKDEATKAAIEQAKSVAEETIGKIEAVLGRQDSASG